MSVRRRPAAWPGALLLALCAVACAPEESQIAGRYERPDDPTRKSWLLAPGGELEKTVQGPDGELLGRRDRWRYERGLFTGTLIVENGKGMSRRYPIARAGDGIGIQVDPEKRTIFVKIEEYKEPQTILEAVPAPK